MNKRLIRKLLAEFVGTCFLVMIVIGSGIMAQNLSSDQLTTRQEFLTTRLTLIEAASQVHLSKTEIETLTGLALKTEQMMTQCTQVTKTICSSHLTFR